MKSNTKLFASIIICAYNDEQNIEKVVRSALAQRYPQKEVIVIDDHSSDNTLKVLKKLKGIKIIAHKKNRGLAYSMTDGAKQAKGKIIVTLQSDCVIRGENWLNYMVAPFRDPEVGVVVSQRIILDKSELSNGASFFNAVCRQELLNRLGKIVVIDYARGKADAYCKELLVKLNYWNYEKYFVAGEDVDISEKIKALGKKILLHPRAEIEYLFSGRQNTISSGLKKAFTYGKAGVPLYHIYKYNGLRSRIYGLSFWALFFLGAAAPFLSSGEMFGFGLIFIFPVLYSSLKNCWIFFKDYPTKIFLVPGVFLYALFWKFLTAIGYYYQFFKTYFDRDVSIHGNVLFKKNEAILNELQVLPGGRGKTVDIGCGGSYFVRNFKDIIGVEENKNICNQLGLKNVIYASATALPFADSSIQTFILSEILEHVKDTKKFLNEVFRTAKNGSHLIVVVPNDLKWFIYRLFNVFLFAAFKNRGHVNFYFSLAAIRKVFLPDRRFIIKKSYKIFRPATVLRKISIPLHVSLHYLLLIEVKKG